MAVVYVLCPRQIVLVAHPTNRRFRWVPIVIPCLHASGSQPRNKHYIIDCLVSACARAWEELLLCFYRRAQPYENPITVPGVPVAQPAMVVGIWGGGALAMSTPTGWLRDGAKDRTPAGRSAA